MVVRRGINETSVLPMARWARDAGRDPAVHRVHGRRPHERLADGRGRPRRRARRDRRRGDAARAPSRRAIAARSRRATATATAAARSALIASVTQPFCGDCTRARISADGHFYTCLFTGEGHDLRAILRDPAASTTRRRRACATRSRRSGASATTATPSCGPRRRRRACRGSRCSRWAAEGGDPPPGCPRAVHIRCRTRGYSGPSEAAVRGQLR